MKKFRKNSLMKRATAFIFILATVVMLATSASHAEETTPEDLSKFSQTVYEDLYAKDGNMKSYGMLGPSASYWVDNQYALGQNVQLVLICEKTHFCPVLILNMNLWERWTSTNNIVTLLFALILDC